MLDQNDRPQNDRQSGSGAGDPDSARDDMLFDREEKPSSGGMLGKWRAGVAAPPGGGYNAPLWRRILVFLIRWGAIATVAFLVLSVSLVFIFGWTGPPPTLNMAGKAMEGVEVRRTWVPLKEMSPHIVRAVIAAEDQAFCTHNGFDAKEIQKALEAAERGRDLRGASTISQQTAKNVFLFNGGGWVRKGFEAWFTVLVEWMWSKPRIMETYLNVAEWGDGIYGIEQAAQERFKVSARDLTPRQAAALAAVLPNPNRWRVDGSYASGRRGNQIQSLMAMVKRDDLATCVVGP
jgi:monofunctional biosynthetic peptidoglycan transglycosylase